MKKKKKTELETNGVNEDRRNFLKTLGLTGAGLALAGGFPGIIHAQAKKEIIVGAIAPLSGFQASVGQHEKAGFEIAIEEINAAGGIKSLGGAKLKAMVANDEGKPESGMAEAERLIRAGAVMLIGADASPVTYATTSVAEKYKICHLVPMSVADNITERGFKYTFRTTDRTGIQGYRIMRFIKALKMRPEANVKTGVIMHLDNIYGKSVADSVNRAAKEMGTIQILDTIPYPQNARDLTAEITKAKSYKPDLLMPVSWVADSIMITNAMYEQKLDVPTFGMCSNHNTPEYIEGVGKRSNNVMSATIAINNLSKKAIAFTKKYEARHKKLPTVHAMSFYEACLLAGDVLERARSTSSDKIRLALANTNYFSDLITREGTIFFDETGQCPSNTRCLIQIVDGKIYNVDPPMFAEREPVFPIPKG
jgi:branched-chain amino acid transport system substrate-binding protein